MKTQEQFYKIFFIVNFPLKYKNILPFFSISSDEEFCEVKMKQTHSKESEEKNIVTYFCSSQTPSLLRNEVDLNIKMEFNSNSYESENIKINCSEFLYDVNFHSSSLNGNKQPFNMYKFSDYEMFEIFKHNINDNGQEYNEYLPFLQDNSIKIVISKKNVIDFMFFISILKTCYRYEKSNSLYKQFDLNKKIINYEKIDKIKNIFSFLFLNVIIKLLNKKKQEIKFKNENFEQFVFFYLRNIEYDKYLNILIHNENLSKNLIIKIIYKYNKYLGNLNYDDINKLLENENEDSNIEKIINLSNGFGTLIKVLKNNFEKISNIFHDKQIHLNESTFIYKVNNLDNIEEIYQNYNFLKNNLNINFSASIWENFINEFRKKNNLNSLQQMKKIFFNNDKYLNLIEKSIETIKINQIESMTNKEVLNIIYYNINGYNDKKLIEFFRHLKLSENFNDEVYNLFEKIKIKFFEYLNEIFKILLSKVKNIRELHIILKLFKNIEFLKSIFQCLEQILRKEKLNLNEKNLDYFYSIVKNIFLIKDFYNNFFKNLYTIFESTEIIKIFSFILKKEINETSELRKFILIFLEEDCTKVKSNDLIEILTNLDNKTVYYLLEKCNKVISINEFYNDTESDNLLFLILIQNSNIFYDKKFKNTFYIKNTINCLNNIKQIIESLNFTYKDSIKLLDLEKKNKILDRLNLLYYNDKNINIKNMWSKIYQNIFLCVNFKDRLTNIINFFQNFFQNSKKDEILFYENLNSELNNKEIRNFLKIINDNSKRVEDDFNISKEFLYLSISKFFINIYDDEKAKYLYNKKEYDLLKIAKEEYEKNLRNLIMDYKQTKTNFIKILLKGISTQNEIKEEINFSKEYLKMKDYNTEILVENLNNILKKEDLKDKIISSIYLIENYKVNKTNLHKKLLNNKNSLMNEEISLDDLKKVIQNTENLKIEIFSDFKASSILKNMYINHDVVPFILEKNEDQINAVKEFLEEDENMFIRMSDISDLLKCLEFCQNLKNMNSKNDEKLLENFYLLIKQNEKFNKIDIYFKNISIKYSDFYDFFTNHLNQNENNKKIVKEIYNKCIFKIIEKDNNYTVQVYYYYKKKETEKSFEDIIELKDKILLRQRDNEDQEYEQICNKFINHVNNISKILNLNNNISSKGYPKELNILLEINKGDAAATFLDKSSLQNLKLSNYQMNKKQKIEDLIEYLKNEEKTQKFIQNETYKNKEFCRFIFGRQFNLINQSVKNKNENDIYYIKKYLTQDKDIKVKEQLKYDNSKKNNELNNMYETANIFIQNTIGKDGLNIIFESSRIKKNGFNGIYLLNSENKDNIEIDTIKLYKFLTNNFPVAQTTLLCNSKTSKEEINCFLNRALLCNLNILFVIMKCENLEIEIGHDLISIINEIYNYKKKNIVSCLFFIYNDKTSSLIKNIEENFDNKIFEPNNLKKEDLTLKDNNYITIYRSKVSGYGKSTQIKMDYKIKNYNASGFEYIYFPLGGDTNRNEIMVRLKNLPKKVYLHIDLLETNQMELIRDFLFSFLVNKCYIINDDIFYYGKDVVIRVEIPNSFTNYYFKYPILKFFNQIEYTDNNIPPFIITKEITSNIQIICNYLKIKNEINQKDLFIPGISHNNNLKTKLNAQILNENECRNLLNETFSKEKNKLINYYQKISFINIVANQLIYFSNNYYLSADELIFKSNENNVKRPELLTIRELYLKNIILLTQHFTQSFFENLIEGQIKAYKQQNSEYNEDLERDNAIKNLGEIDEYINFEKIKPSLVFINDDGGAISIITTENEGSQEYKNLETLFNSQNIGQTIKLVNYRLISSKEILSEIKKF